ncbi:MAG: 3-oxoacyl-ACP synthase, partial [Flavobacteriaceae bacterium]|nr:3-oxoacyl-ACP synthase [Flavobacteriaceae bacterium]
TGSGMGCMQDTEKFLNALLENKEAFLTPTAFIQSTHNTVGGQIALGLQCKAYNNTYVHGSLSLESALLDAQLTLQEGSAKTVLVGGVDELGTEFVDYVHLKEQQETHHKNVPYGEGAAFFLLTQDATKSNVLLKGMQTIPKASEDEIEAKLLQFLSENKIKVSDIDGLFFGTTGDGHDGYYDTVSNKFLAEIVRIPFKEYSGDFYTCMGFAVWWACHLLQMQCQPGAVCKQTIALPYKNCLIYNQEKGENHSFILLSRT